MTGEKLEIIVRKVNEALDDTSTKNITEKNDKINAASIFVARKLVLRVSGNRKKEKNNGEKEGKPK